MLFFFYIQMPLLFYRTDLNFHKKIKRSPGFFLELVYEKTPEALLCHLMLDDIKDA